MRNCLRSARDLRPCGEYIQLALFGERDTQSGKGLHLGATDPGVATTEFVTDALLNGAAVAIGVSGGKDSSAVALRTIDYLEEAGHTGPRLLIHSDLGRIEWRQSLPVCQRLAERLKVELVVVRREQGDLLDRFHQRWRANVRRYAELTCVKLILPWPTATMRYCTGELKTAIICRELVRRFPGCTILSVSGVRREESSSRAKAPVAATQPKLMAVRRQTSGFDWRPIIHWSKSEVLGYLARKRLDPHEAYTRYHSSRVSCCYCVLGTRADLAASASCAENAEVYRELVRLEVESSFAFQSSHWLADIAPHLLTPELREAVARAKVRAAMREGWEARIPPKLLYAKGWPTVVPTRVEAELLAEVRQAVARTVGIQIGFTTADSIIDRYEQLLSARTAAT